MENEIGYQIRTLSNLLKRKIFAYAPPPDHFGLTGMQARIVAYLYENRDRAVYQKEIEEHFSIRRSTASRFLSTLEEKGILERETADFDARRKKLSLTPHACLQHEKIAEKVREIEQQAAKGLTEQEIQQFMQIAEKIKRNLQ